jgi:hypothetical protein
MSLTKPCLVATSIHECEFLDSYCQQGDSEQVLDRLTIIGTARAGSTQARQTGEPVTSPRPSLAQAWGIPQAEDVPLSFGRVGKE